MKLLFSCDVMDCSMSGSFVIHCLLQFALIHLHRFCFGCFCLVFVLFCFLVGQKDLHSSSPVRTPNLQLAADNQQEGIETHQNRSGTKDKLQYDRKRGTITFNSYLKANLNLILQEGTNENLCSPKPRERSSDPHKRLNQTCLSV